MQTTLIWHNPTELPTVRVPLLVMMHNDDSSAPIYTRRPYRIAIFEDDTWSDKNTFTIIPVASIKLWAYLPFDIM